MLTLQRTGIKTIVKDNHLHVSFRISTVTTPLPTDSQLIAIIKPNWNNERYATCLTRDKNHVTSKDVIIPAPINGIPPHSVIDVYSNGVIVATVNLCLTNDEEIWRCNAPETLSATIVKGKGVDHIVFDNIVWKCPDDFQPTNNTYMAVSCPGSTATMLSLSDVVLVGGVLMPLKVLVLEYPDKRRSRYVLSMYEGDILLASMPIRASITQSNDISSPKPLSTPTIPKSTPTIPTIPTIPSISPKSKKRKVVPEFVFDIPNELEYVIGDNKTAYLCMFKLPCPENYIPIHAELVIHCNWNDQTIRRGLTMRDRWLMFIPIKLDIDDPSLSLVVQLQIEQSGEKVFENTSFLRNVITNNINIAPMLSAALEELLYIATNDGSNECTTTTATSST